MLKQKKTLEFSLVYPLDGFERTDVNTLVTRDQEQMKRNEKIDITP